MDSMIITKLTVSLKIYIIDRYTCIILIYRTHFFLDPSLCIAISGLMNLDINKFICYFIDKLLVLLFLLEISLVGWIVKILKQIGAKNLESTERPTMMNILK
jgi:hypothetical protein